ncbi:SDR family oxidoreductase [Weizmannia sp. FSL W8-0401]|uniref:SDR family oxidoreductase n=1 Tax=Weizmannia sp. FSL W8-0401 TaxID=2954554 RepID=UPI0030F4D82F
MLYAQVLSAPLWEALGQLGEQLSNLLGKPMEEAIEFFAKANIPMERYGKLEKKVKSIMFLASERASYITGQSINIDGFMVKAKF